MSSHQLNVCELLSQGEGVTTDGQDVSLDGLRLGFQHSESVRHRGVDLCQRFFVLAERGEFTDQTLRYLLHRFPIELRTNTEKKKKERWRH